MIEAAPSRIGPTGRYSLLISTSTFPPRPDEPYPRFVFDLAAALTRHAEVTVLTPSLPGIPKRERWGALEIVRFDYFWPSRLQRLAHGDGMRDNLRASTLAKAQVVPLLLAQALQLRKLIRSKRIDIVNSHWMVPQGLTTAWVKSMGVPFRHVLHIHAADVYLLQRMRLGAAIARWIVARCDAVLADGSHVREALDQLVGRPSGAQLQPMGAHVARFREQRPGDRVASPFRGGYLLFIGRFVEKKGVTYLVRALRRVRERVADLGLILVGYGPLEGEIRAEVRRLGLDDAVLFAGPKNHAELASYLQGCRCAVVPSIIDRNGETEGMPTVVVECMAAGARVVATAVDGIPDVVRDGQNGWLCRPADPDHLAEKILTALDEESSTVQAGALTTATAYDWARVAGNYALCFEGLLSARA